MRKHVYIAIGCILAGLVLGLPFLPRTLAVRASERKVVAWLQAADLILVSGTPFQAIRDWAATQSPVKLSSAPARPHVLTFDNGTHRAHLVLAFDTSDKLLSSGLLAVDPRLGYRPRTFAAPVAMFCFLAYCLLLVVRAAVANVRRNSARCPKCGYPVAHSPVCTECGHNVAELARPQLRSS